MIAAFDPGNLQGLIPIFAGVYLFLMANGTLPKNPKDPAATEAWREKWGKFLKIACPLLVIFGGLQLAGVV